MNEEAWRTERDDRTLHYAGRTLDPNRWIQVEVDPDYARSYDGQVAVITATNLLARMSPSIAVEVPAVQMVAPLPWAGQDLRDFVLREMRRADPWGRFTGRPRERADYGLCLGRSRGAFAAHGSGWNAYLGPGPSPIAPTGEPNPFGPAFAAILATAHLFVTEFGPPPEPSLFSVLDWSSTATPSGVALLRGDEELGELWTVGVGFIGTAILYFLTLLTRTFACALIDMDEVKTHNLDRSSIFGYPDVGSPKVLAAAGFLSRVGVRRIQTEVVPLHESELWRRRQEGCPDLVISTANEHNVRYWIESKLPPVQVYGTTGKNWQATVVRHLPFVDPCSECLFGLLTTVAPTVCATGTLTDRSGSREVDATLPFLSFAAGLMAAAEIVKLNLSGFPHSMNRTSLYTKEGLRVSSVAMTKTARCVCATRLGGAHRRMIGGTRYADLSGLTGRVSSRSTSKALADDQSECVRPRHESHEGT